MEKCNHTHRSDHRHKNTIIGIILVVLGLFLLNSNMHFLPNYLSHIIISWQMFLIVMGIILIIAKQKIIGGLFMIGIGGVFLWNKIMPFTPIQWEIAWPAVFIFVGFALVLAYLIKNSEHTKQVKLKKTKKKKSKYDDVEFDIDKIEPIED